MNTLIFNNIKSFKIGDLDAKIYLGNKLLNRYKPLEYISSTRTGGLYIDLGCCLLENTDDIKIDIKFNIKGVGKSASGTDPLLATLIASLPEVSPWPGFVLRRVTANSTNLQLQAKWLFTNSTKQSSASKYLSKYLSHPKTNNSSTLIEAHWQNIYEFTEILDNIPQSQVNNTTCALFCALNESNNPFRFCEADLYYLKFTKGNTVIRDLIPVYDIVTLEAGLYDKLNGVFYASIGDEPFVASQ